MKRSTFIILLFLFGFTCICRAEEWYAAQEGSSYDYISPLGSLLSAEESPNSKYVPCYSSEDLQYILDNANNYSGITDLDSKETASIASAPGMVSTIPGKRG